MSERQEDNPDSRVSKALSSTANRMNMGAKYQGALEAVLAIPIGAGLGYLADKNLETGPVGLFIGFAFGFGAFILRVVRMRPEEEPKEKK